MNKSNNKTQVYELAELLQGIREYDLEDTSYSAPIAEDRHISQADFLKILQEIKNNIHNYKIIDVRSENEFENNAIPYSINLPVLNNIERHKVGLLYTKHSPQTALSLAGYLAKKKEKEYLYKAGKLTEGKNAIVYCWRGGERSSYIVNLLNKNNIKAYKLIEGQKGFRKIVQEFLYEKTIPVISLSGLTGSGKSEVLELIQKNYKKFPVIHLEKCAGHASSVFGEIRYFVKGEKQNNQQQFETNIFMEILPYIDYKKDLPVFLSEDESKKIGPLNIPPAIWAGLNMQNNIYLNCSLKERIQRLIKEYFKPDSNDENVKTISKTKAVEQLKFLSKKLSNEKILQYKEWINSNQFEEFFTDIMINYYDKIYKKLSKKPLFIMDSSDVELIVKQLVNFWKENVFRF